TTSLPFVNRGSGGAASESGELRAYFRSTTPENGTGGSPSTFILLFDLKTSSKMDIYLDRVDGNSGELKLCVLQRAMQD
ncbi:hypothetical protein U1Q18_016457, partial [Sarracenia purpurea var. burkii]